ncbi:MAG: ExeA family protein, partial [Gammaproteobacteria bacterium]
MYLEHFGLSATPFSIAPDPRWLYLSQRHREGLAHLHFGASQSGGFVQLTGEVGTGKTTLCRMLLRQLPDGVNVALILNPPRSVQELLQTLCDELFVDRSGAGDSVKALMDIINTHLLRAHGRGVRTVLIIDEAQNLAPDVLEQVRLLTNLETNERKLLQIFLIGQPELRRVLAAHDMRQIAQRITARCHLEPLDRTGTREYVEHRLTLAGARNPLFTNRALRKVHRLTGGIPRLINTLCDRALLGAFALDRPRVAADVVARAARELAGKPPARVSAFWAYSGAAAAIAALAVSLLAIAGVDISLIADRVQGLSQPTPARASSAPQPHLEVTEDTDLRLRPHEDGDGTNTGDTAS